MILQEDKIYNIIKKKLKICRKRERKKKNQDVWRRDINIVVTLKNMNDDKNNNKDKERERERTLLVFHLKGNRILNRFLQKEEDISCYKKFWN